MRHADEQAVSLPRLLWSPQDLNVIPAAARAAAEAEYAKVVARFDAELSTCERSTCPDHAEHIAWVIRKEDDVKDLIHGWAFSQL